MSDFSKLERPPLLHAAFRALDAFRAARAGGATLPRPGSAEDADEILALAAGLAGDVEAEGARASALLPGAPPADADAARALLRTFASGSSGEVSPMCALFGGLVGQEVIKARSRFGVASGE